jgi:hemolysin III
MREGKEAPMSSSPATDRQRTDPDHLEQSTSVLAVVKPRLRGWLHAGMAPLALAAGIVLIALATTGPGRIGGAVFLAASVLLFGTSGVYHRGNWGARGEAVLRRMDHANIYVFIAASYTPLALLLLQGTSQVLLLSLIWSAAVGGLVFRLCWITAPRWLYTLLYIVMGWAALGWMGAFYASGGLAVLVLILAGGACYTLGAVVYARKRPNPSPGWFGFHEIFHVGTIGGFVCHYIAISMITYSAR